MLGGRRTPDVGGAVHATIGPMARSSRPFVPRPLRAALLIALSLSMTLSLALGTPRARAAAPRAQPASAEGAAPEATEPAAPPVPAEFATPWVTVNAFLKEWAGYVYSVERGEADTRARDDALEHLAFGPGVDTQAKVDTANRLVRVLNALGDVNGELFSWAPPEEGVREIELFEDELPNGRRITVVRGEEGRWLFGAETLAGLNALEASLGEAEPVYPNAPTLTTASDTLRELVPPVLRGTSVFGVQHWQWIALFALLLVAVTLDALLRAVLSRLVLRWERRRGIDADADAVRRGVRPAGLLAGSLLVLSTVSMLGLPIDVLRVVQVAARVVVMVSAVWSSFGVVDLVGAFTSSRARATSTKIDDLVIPLLRKASKAFLTVLGLIYIADSLDIEILPLLTGLGIGGLALGLAAKDSIENFFGSIAVIFDSPFDVGDWVNIDGHEGTVEQIGLRSTRIRTFYNSLISVPNATLVRAVVDNYGRREYRRYSTTLNLTYATPPERMESFCEGVREIVRLLPYTRKDVFHVYVKDFGAHSIDVMVYVFFRTPDWPTELRERHRFILEIVRLADRLGVDFAFPTQTIELARAPGPGEPAANGVPRAPDADESARESGAEAARAISRGQAWRETVPAPVQVQGPPRPTGAPGQTGKPSLRQRAGLGKGLGKKNRGN